MNTHVSTSLFFPPQRHLVGFPATSHPSQSQSLGLLFRLGIEWDEHDFGLLSIWWRWYVDLRLGGLGVRGEGGADFEVRCDGHCECLLLESQLR